MAVTRRDGDRLIFSVLFRGKSENFLQFPYLAVSPRGPYTWMGLKILPLAADKKRYHNYE